MTENFCPACGEQLPVDSINIAEGVALCPGCRRLSRLSEVVDRKRPVAEVLSDPPAGCSISSSGREVVVYASQRSLAGFFGMLFVALFWNGIVSVFVLIAAAGLYTNLVGPPPDWFPAPPMDDAMGLGMTIFLCIFLLPFVTIGSILAISVIMAAGGKTEVVIGEREARVRTGIGFLSWGSRFDPDQVREVKIGASSWETNGKPSKQIVIEADRTVKFGSMLPDARREWLHAILHELLVNADPERMRDLLSMASRSRYSLHH